MPPKKRVCTELSYKKKEIVSREPNIFTSQTYNQE